MQLLKTYLTILAVFAFTLADVAKAETPPASSIEPTTVVIVISGQIPGFTQAQLADYLTKRTQEEIGAPWHFVAEDSGDALAANRLVWSFKTLRVDWKGGSHREFPSPSYSETSLSAEVKLYLKGDYQTTILDTNPLVSNEFEDKSLIKMVHYVTHELFVENTPTNRPSR